MGKMSQNLSSAAVVIGALRVKRNNFSLVLVFSLFFLAINIQQKSLDIFWLYPYSSDLICIIVHSDTDFF